MPTEVTSIQALGSLLDAASHEERVAWIRSLNGKQQYALYALADGNPVSVKDFVREEGKVVRHHGRADRRGRLRGSSRSEGGHPTA